MDISVLWILLLFGDAGPTTIRYDSFRSMSASPLATQIEATVSVVGSPQTLERPHETTAGILIKRRQKGSALNKLLDKMDSDVNARDKRKKKNETLFEAYWPGGDWVYKRTQRTRRKRRTRPSTEPTTINGTTTSRATTTTPTTIEGQNTTTASTYINFVCQHPCTDIFENYGTICAQRYNGWAYEVKEFFDACEMITENCVYHATNHFMKNYRGQWMIILRGPCYMLTTTMAAAPTNATAILQRKKEFVDIDMLQFRTRI